MQIVRLSHRYNLVALFLLFLLLVTIGLTVQDNTATENQSAQINLMGRQRMLVQRMHRLLLLLQSPEAPAPRTAQYATELGQASELFNETLLGFANGTGMHNNLGKTLTFETVTDPGAQQLLQETQTLWNGYYPLLHALVNGPTPDTVKLQVAVAYGCGQHPGPRQQVLV